MKWERQRKLIEILFHATKSLVLYLLLTSMDVREYSNRQAFIRFIGSVSLSHLLTDLLQRFVRLNSPYSVQCSLVVVQLVVVVDIYAMVLFCGLRLTQF